MESNSSQNSYNRHVDFIKIHVQTLSKKAEGRKIPVLSRLCISDFRRDVQIFVQINRLNIHVISIHWCISSYDKIVTMASTPGIMCSRNPSIRVKKWIAHCGKIIMTFINRR